jgi:hypothetical protein
MAKYSTGIDLGTTHSAVSFFELDSARGRGTEQAVLQVAQLTKPGAVEERSLLPSFIYLPNENEFPPASLDLPWGESRARIIGEFARSHGAKVPSRLISSAKSWLCHAGVDRTAAILPWEAPPEVEKISPLDASAAILRHLRSAWEYQFKGTNLSEEEIVLTVPASFDAAARELTNEAASLAGLKQVVLLEEPQAALYAWLESRGEAFRTDVQVGDVILVIDVGGGTSDFSLIGVSETDGNLELTRLAVGDHILLGGDNMDLTLAFAQNQKLTAEGKKLDSWQLNSLVHACREAKERLFQDAKLKKVPIAIASRGSGLIGGSIKTEIERETVEELLTDGFFPTVPVTEQPRTARRSGFAQMALPYAQDPAVTRHLAAFLTRQKQGLAGNHEPKFDFKGKSFVHPTAVLFNGGVFKSETLRRRVMEVLNEWLAGADGASARELAGAELDLAVARGAAYYGWVRKGHGIRIRGGTARAYYVGVEAAAPAVPGFEPRINALCVAPFGMEEGTEADVPPQEFGLVVGEPTRFRFFASSVRRDDKPGDTVQDAAKNPELEEVSPIETSLSPGDGREGFVPVNLQAAVTEVGTLELRCIEKKGAGRWKLELNVRMKE